MIWVPVLVGCGVAIWKAIKGTIDFTTLVNAATSIVLIAMPLTWWGRAGRAGARAGGWQGKGTGESACGNVRYGRLI